MVRRSRCLAVVVHRKYLLSDETRRTENTMHMKTRATLAVLVVAGTAGGLITSGAVGSSSGGGGGQPPVMPAPAPGAAPPGDPATQASPDGGITTVSSAQRSQFSALREPATQEDAAAARTETALRGLGSPQRQWSVNPSLGRLAYNNNGEKLLLVPGNGAVCLVTLGAPEGDGTGCAAGGQGDTAPQGILRWGTYPGASTAVGMQGVLPDGSSHVMVTGTNGQQTSVRLNSHGAFSITLLTDPRSVTWTSASGQVVKAL